MANDGIRAIIAVAQAKADRDVAQGIADLEAAIVTAPEWGRRDRSAVPIRASLEGMLNHLHKSHAMQHPDEAGAA